MGISEKHLAEEVVAHIKNGNLRIGERVRLRRYDYKNQRSIMSYGTVYDQYHSQVQVSWLDDGKRSWHFLHELERA